MKTSLWYAPTKYWITPEKEAAKSQRAGWSYPITNKSFHSHLSVQGFASDNSVEFNRD